MRGDKLQAMKKVLETNNKVYIHSAVSIKGPGLVLLLVETFYS